MIARAAVLAVALVAIAWLGLSWRNATIEQRATALVAQDVPPRDQVDEALRDLDDADLLNPDRAERDALRFGLYVKSGRVELAREPLERMVQAEPANAEAWVLLASLTERSDPRRSREARARLLALNPRGPAEGTPP